MILRISKNFIYFNVIFETVQNQFVLYIYIYYYDKGSRFFLNFIYLYLFVYT